MTSGWLVQSVQSNVEMPARTKPLAFVSYCHQDRQAVLPIEAELRRRKYDVWIDTRQLSAGSNLVDEVSRAIARADLYVVALSSASLASPWVTHELTLAVNTEINTGRPRIVPLRLESVSVPPVIANRVYVDIFDVTAPEARRRFVEILHHLGWEGSSKVRPIVRPTELASVIFELSETTTACYGGIEKHHSREDVEAEAKELLVELQRSAYGVLLNFVDATEMDFTARPPQFPNGQVRSRIERASGELIGTTARRAVVEVEILSPDETRLAKLVSSKLSAFGVTKAVYTLLLAAPIADFQRIALRKLQRQYVILGWDPDDGADVKIDDDLTASVCAEEDRIRVGISTRYAFQFGDRLRQFSVNGFVQSLLAA
jgi:hypothetical protein